MTDSWRFHIKPSTLLSSPFNTLLTKKNKAVKTILLLKHVSDFAACLQCCLRINIFLDIKPLLLGSVRLCWFYFSFVFLFFFPPALHVVCVMSVSPVSAGWVWLSSTFPTPTLCLPYSCTYISSAPQTVQHLTLVPSFTCCQFIIVPLNVNTVYRLH